MGGVSPATGSGIEPAVTLCRCRPYRTGRSRITSSVEPAVPRHSTKRADYATSAVHPDRPGHAWSVAHRTVADRVPWCGGGEGVVLGVRCVGCAALGSLVVGLVVISSIGASIWVMEPSER